MTSAIGWFRELDQTQIGVVGGKNANLGELVKHLRPLGERVRAAALPADVEAERTLAGGST